MGGAGGAGAKPNRELKNPGVGGGVGGGWSGGGVVGASPKRDWTTPDTMRGLMLGLVGSSGCCVGGRLFGLPGGGDPSGGNRCC